MIIIRLIRLTLITSVRSHVFHFEIFEWYVSFGLFANGKDDVVK